jgi:hypothetical protein
LILSSWSLSKTRQDPFLGQWHCSPERFNTTLVFGSSRDGEWCSGDMQGELS